MRRVKHVLSYVLVLSMCFTLFFFSIPVHADNVYWSTVNGNCVNYYGSNSTPAYTKIFTDNVIGNRFTVNGSYYYSWYKHNEKIVSSVDSNFNTCQAFSSGNESYQYVFNDLIGFKYTNSTSFTSSDYLALYDLGSFQASSNANLGFLGLGALLTHDYNLNKLTLFNANTNYNSWSTSDPSNPYVLNFNNDVYVIGTGGSSIWFLSFSPFSGTAKRDSTTYNISNSQYLTLNNTTVYFTNFTRWDYGNSYHYGFNWYNTSLTDGFLYASFLMFASGSGAAEPSPDWGKPANVMYNTRIAGSGSASENNIDRIVWSPNIDSNANELPVTAKVQIRAVPGSYTADSSQNLLQKTWNDFRLDHSKQYTVYDGPAHLGRFEIKWGEVVDHFNFFPYSWVPDIQLVDDYYLKMGWIYQIKLIIESDEYESQWINIYTATSSGVEPSEVITNSDDLTQELVENILIINNLNETTNVNWTINDTTINMSEYNETDTNGKPWWSYLLEAILSLFQVGDGEQQTINNTNNLNIDFNDKLNEYNQIEDQQLQSLDTNLNVIEVESDMLENNKFISSANWVAAQYNRMTNGTVIGSLIGFSLLFGLALIFIGKIR